MRPGEVSRGGFTYAYGNFQNRDGVHRLQGAHLEWIFLPRLTPKANELIRENRNFVRGQLQHCGVAYHETQFIGNGLQLLKKVLKAGMCDKVPSHIAKLRLQMHREWLAKVSAAELSGYSRWIMEKYFVDGAGNPDSTKTTEVVGIPHHRGENPAPRTLRQAVGWVSGLHHATGVGSTETVYLGWDLEAVKKAARDHAAKEAQEGQAKMDAFANKMAGYWAKAEAREAERVLRHEQRLADPQKWNLSPVGHYKVDSPAITSAWLVEPDDMRLTIWTCLGPTGVYKVDLWFGGFLSGRMMIGSDKAILDQFCAKHEERSRRMILGSNKDILDQFCAKDEEEDEEPEEKDDEDSAAQDDEDSEEEDDEESEEENDEDSEEGHDWHDTRAEKNATVGSKRTATAISGDSHEPPHKKIKAPDAGSPGKFFVQVSCDNFHHRYRPSKGVFKFSGPDMSSFAAEVDLKIGEGVPFTALLIKPWEDPWETI